MKTLSDFNLQGEACLRNIISQTTYQTIEQALASLSLFTHPDTVKQTRGSNLFRIVRYREGQKRGETVTTEKGNRILLCDNTAPD